MLWAQVGALAASRNSRVQSKPRKSEAWKCNYQLLASYHNYSQMLELCGFIYWFADRDCAYVYEGYEYYFLYFRR